MKKFLFILCPPYSGSTVLWKILQTSPVVSAMPKEGQFMPEVRGIMRNQPYDLARPMPWDRIRGVWEHHWNMKKPILLEKSPPNLMRAFEIEEEFEPTRFVSMIRNPYAACEGIYRRNDKSLQDSIDFWVRLAKFQKKNIEGLESVVHFSYEQLVSEPHLVKDRLLEFLPDLQMLDMGVSMKVHSVAGRKTRKLQDFNARKIDRLNNRELTIINTTLTRHQDLMEYFGYSLIEPTANREISRLARRAGEEITQAGEALTTKITNRLVRSVPQARTA